MSIYISLVSLEDKDLPYTVKSALESADNPDQIHIGVAACVSKEFYKEYVEPLNSYSQVTLQRFNVENYKGLGKGRKASRFAYNNEDYILQVDPHTHFQKGWDTFLICEFESAISSLGNEKIIFTSYLPGYYINDQDEVVFTNGNEARYNIFLNKPHRDFLNITLWTDIPISQFPEEMRDERWKDRYLPSNKITACFMFGNKNFVNFSGLPENIIFWEEEIVQAIELLSEGFYLVFLNSILPLAHRYTNSPKTDRQNTPLVYQLGNLPLSSMITANFYDYIEENREKCDKYKKYCKYDVYSGSVRPFYIPKTYDFC